MPFGKKFVLKTDTECRLVEEVALRSQLVEEVALRLAQTVPVAAPPGFIVGEHGRAAGVRAASLSGR